jgi:hypothetical protein
LPKDIVEKLRQCLRGRYPIVMIGAGSEAFS